jgi:hypothetical protein
MLLSVSPGATVWITGAGVAVGGWGVFVGVFVTVAVMVGVAVGGVVAVLATVGVQVIVTVGEIVGVVLGLTLGVFVGGRRSTSTTAGVGVSGTGVTVAVGGTGVNVSVDGGVLVGASGRGGVSSVTVAQAAVRNRAARRANRP